MHKNYDIDNNDARDNNGDKEENWKKEKKKKENEWCIGCSSL